MAIDLSGQDSLPKATVVTIEISNTHPLIQLASVLPWGMLMDQVVVDRPWRRKRQGRVPRSEATRDLLLSA